MSFFVIRLVPVLPAMVLLAACQKVSPDDVDEKIRVSGISLDRSELSLTVGESETLTATVIPSDATNMNVIWSSSNSASVDVDVNGSISAVKVGEAAITAETADGGYTVVCSVRVTAVTVDVTAVVLDKTDATIDAGGQLTLKATVVPSNAANKEVSWSSSDTSCATVDENGTVIAIAIGAALITCTSKAGAKVATCKITVTAPDPDNLLRTAYIPDPVFLDYCRNQMDEWDTNRDGRLYKAEAAAVTSIDVANIYGHAISSLNGIEYFTGITYLDCSLNNLIALDVSSNSRLIELYCNYNQRLGSLKISYSSLKILNCSACDFTTLDLSRCTRLEELWCYYNELTSIDVSGCTALRNMDVDGNNLTALDLSKSYGLRGLICSNNSLSELELSACTALTTLECSNNELASLDLSKNSGLIHLHCDLNRLDEIDVTRNKALEVLVCNGNRLTSIRLGPDNSRVSLIRSSNNLLSSEALNAVFMALPYSGSITIHGNPGTDVCDKSIAENKNWKVEVE